MSKTYLGQTAAFPNATDKSIEICSPETVDYNCLAWALEDEKHWWEPEAGCFWPKNAPRNMRLDSVAELLAQFGFAAVSNARLEKDVAKIALYSSDGKTCDHFARQLPSGKWTSKLGASFDVVHSLSALEGGVYGKVVLILARKQQPRN